MYNYDEQIERLTKDPEKIQTEWSLGKGLFQFVGKDIEVEEESISCGCLTMIREDSDKYKAIINGKIDEELTQKIAKDKNIPKNFKTIGVKHLPAFKKWQKRIEKLQNSEI